jgi:integrase
MFAAARNGRDLRLMHLFWHTGGRLSEVLGARVGDLTERGIVLTNLKRRMSRDKHVFLSPAFLGELRAATAADPPEALLVGRLRDGRRMTRQRAEQIVRRAAVDAGVFKKRHTEAPMRPASPHLFRHGHAVNLILEGVPLPGVSQQLGHASLASVQPYVQLADPQLEALIGRARF